MKHKSLVVLSAWVFVLFWGTCAHASSAQPIVVDDAGSRSDFRLGNDRYEVVFSKAHGAILQVRDLQTGTVVSTGSADDSLWTASFASANGNPSGGYMIYSRSYGDKEGGGFSYSWDTTASKLLLVYNDSAKQEASATVMVTPSAEGYFDLQLISFKNNTAEALCNFDLPHNLMVSKSAVQYGYLPALAPGVRLTRSFFQNKGVWLQTYPSANGFADYVAVDVGGSHLSVYSVYPHGPITPARLGFTKGAADASFAVYHSFFTWVVPGGNYSSPQVRVRIGEDAERTALAYRKDNAMDAYRSIRAKLGSNFEILAKSMMIKGDLKLPFAQQTAKIPALPSPALLHTTDFEPSGPLRYCPDVLPPNPAKGTSADFRRYVEAAHQHGLLVMPYTDPIYYDPISPTVTKDLPAAGLTLDQVAVQEDLRGKGKIFHEPVSHYAFTVVSPSLPFVTEHLKRMMNLWKDNAGAHVKVDYVFWDQVGAYPSVVDHNPRARASDGGNPVTGYFDVWRALSKEYRDQVLGTEHGWDRLMETMPIWYGGFSLMRNAEMAAGEGLGQPYPLATWMLHDKVLFYQHDLANRSMTLNKTVLKFNLAFGFGFSYMWQVMENSPDPWWIDLLNRLQQTVAYRCAGVPLSHYEELANAVTRSTFGDVKIISNWRPTDSYPVTGVQNGVLPVDGYYVQTDDGNLVVGCFSSLNGKTLEPSNAEHHVLIEQDADRCRIRHVIREKHSSTEKRRESTALTINIPSWSADSPIHIYAVDFSRRRLGEETGFARSGQQVIFVYQRNWEGQVVGSYEIVGMPNR